MLSLFTVTTYLYKTSNNCTYYDLIKAEINIINQAELPWNGREMDNFQLQSTSWIGLQTYISSHVVFSLGRYWLIVCTFLFLIIQLFRKPTFCYTELNYCLQNSYVCIPAQRSTICSEQVFSRLTSLATKCVVCNFMICFRDEKSISN